MRLVLRACSAAAAVGLAGVVAPAAAPPPGPYIPLGKRVDPDVVRRVGEWVATADGSAPKGSLIDEVLDLVRQNKDKGLSTRELAEQLARRHGDLAQPEKFDALFNQFSELQKLAGPLAGMFPQPRVDSPDRPDPHGKSPAQPNPSPRASAPAAGPKTAPGVAQPPTPRPGVRPPPSVAADDPDGPGRRFRGSRGMSPFDGPGGMDRLPRFAEAMPPEGDLWAAREQRAKAEAEDRTKRNRQFSAVRGFWEKNVGKLDDTPAVRDMLRDMFAGPTPIAPDAAEGLLALLGDPKANPRGFVKWATDQGDLFDDMKLSPFGRRLGGLALPTFNSGPDVAGPLGYQSGGIAAEGSWLPVILFAAVAGGSLLAWRFWPRGGADLGPRAIPGLGPWPVDPRLVADRADLIRAFEYLSVLVCGAGARVSNHVALAAALRTATGAADAAEPLARGYALARYTPDADPLPPGTIAEARGHLCRLAGVPAP